MAKIINFHFGISPKKKVVVSLILRTAVIAFFELVSVTVILSDDRQNISLIIILSTNPWTNISNQPSGILSSFASMPQ
jgi:hypothetical protein